MRQTSEFVKLLIHRGFMHSKDDDTQTSLNESLDRRSFIDDEQFLNILTIELVKKFAKGLGFSIIGRRDGSGVFISHIVSYTLNSVFFNSIAKLNCVNKKVKALKNNAF